MSGPGVTSICTGAPWMETPLCDPPLGNETHLPHSGRRHVCPNAFEPKTISARTTKLRIPALHFVALTSKFSMASGPDWTARRKPPGRSSGRLAGRKNVLQPRKTEDLKEAG